MKDEYSKEYQKYKLDDVKYPIESYVQDSHDIKNESKKIH